MTLPRLRPTGLLRCTAALLAALWAVGACFAADALQEARQLSKQGQWARALERIEQAVAEKPKDAQARFLHGVILAEMNRRDEAIAAFTALTEEFPELPEPYNNLAVLYAQQGRYDLARDALEMAVRANPGYATAHENLGDLYARLAAQAYDKALQLDAANAAARGKLALVRELMATSAPAGQAGATAPPPAPAARPAPARGSAAPAEERSAAIARTVRGWAAAWSARDAGAYLAYYAPDFRTPGGIPREAWEKERRSRIARAGLIAVSIEDLRLAQDGPDRAVARFSQRYRSAAGSSATAKHLVLIQREGRWLIQEERVGS